MKRISTTLFLSLLFLILFSSIAMAIGNDLSVDGVIKNVELESIEGRTLIHEGLLKELGFDVTKDERTATVKDNNVTFIFTLNTNKVKVNDIELELDAKSYYKSGEVKVPLRFFFETLGYEVKWDGEKGRVIVERGDEITYPVKIQDNGETYYVNEEPETIVSLAPSVTETLFALGVGEKVKGRTQYCNYPEEVSEIQVVGNMTDPSVEVIIDINPDLIIASTHYKKEVLDKFQEAGIQTVSKASPETIDEMYDFILKMGAIVDRNYEARALVSSMKAKVETVKGKLNYVKERPRVYYVVGAGEWGEYTAGKDTFISELITIAGGKNIADDVTGWKYSLEKLIDKDPEIIVGGEFNINTIKNGENYKILSAVRKDNCIVVNEDIFSRPSPRFINEGLKILLEIFHKDIASKLGF